MHAIRRPISLHVTEPSLHYVRVHRRHGTRDRFLPQDEIQVNRFTRDERKEKAVA